tara:strand:+ start:479 stop:751 length:273 start_codon:yes stop_codon:yes gene_type:complete
MPEIKVTVTETQYKSLQYIALDPSEWAENAVHERCRHAINEICGILMAHCNDNNIAMQIGKDAQVSQAFSLGLVDTRANVAIENAKVITA